MLDLYVKMLLNCRGLRVLSYYVDIVGIFSTLVSLSCYALVSSTVSSIVCDELLQLYACAIAMNWVQHRLRFCYCAV